MSFQPAKYSEVTYFLMRLVVGLLLACHGAQKLFGAFGGQVVTGNPLMLGAGIIEFFGGLLFLIGLFTRPAAFILSGLMAVAYFMAHAPGGFLPLVNKGELAVLYCFVFLYFTFAGGGAWSLDRLIWKRD